MPRIQPHALLAALALIAPATAHAGFFAAQPIDGPSADIVRIGGVDTARDGGSVIVYVKKVAGIEHIFAARLVDGIWQAPERLDPNLPLPSGEPVVGVAKDGQAVVAFTNNGQLYAIVRRARDTAWPAPAAVGATPAATPSIDLSVNGVGYLVWASGGDVRAATLDRTARTFKPLEDPLDVVPADEAGTGTGRPEVAAAADGTGLAAWGEAGHVYARRLLHTVLSQIPQELGVPSFEDHVGGTADLPIVDTTDDSSFAWVTFRQQFDNAATTRVLTRRLVGSAYDPPIDVGAGNFGGEGATNPAMDVAGEEGIAAFASETTLSHTPFAALEWLDIVRAPFGLSQGNAVESRPAIATGETSQTAAVWFDGIAGSVEIHGRSFKRAKPVDAETTLSDPALGPVDNSAGLFAASDKYGDTVIPFIQGSPGPRQGTLGNRRLVAAVWDRPPVNLIPTSTYKWHTPRPLGWEPVREVWGAIHYTVYVDGEVFDTTDRTQLAIAGRIPDGVHSWRLVATDDRGQTGTSSTRTLRIDGTGPRLAIRFKGRRAARKPLRIVVRAEDAGAGVRSLKIDFGDGSPPAFGSVFTHRFARGSYVITVRGVDKVGNERVVTRRLRIK